MRFKKIVLTLALTFGILPTVCAQSQGDTLWLSKAQCVEIALQENPTIRVADMEIKRMEYSKQEIIGSLFPSIDFSTAYQRAIELQTLSMNFGGQSNKIKMGMENTWNLGFTAQLPLINASLWKSIHLTGTQVAAAIESARSSRIEMVNNVNKAYYALLLAVASRDVVRTNYEIAKLNADVYQKQFEQGTASEYDVLRSSVQVTNLEPELLQADISIRQCSLMLKVLMGMDSQVEVMPNITLADMQQQMYGLAPGLNRSISNNSSLRTLDIQTKLLKQQLDLKKFAYIPSLGMQYGLNWSAMSNGNPFKNQEFNPYSNVAFSLSVPIFSGLSRYNAMRQAKVQLNEMTFQRENLVNNLNMQVDLAIENIERQVKQIDSSKQGKAQAEKAYDIMQKSFDIGAASYLNLRDAELAKTSANLAYLQSIYNYLVSTSELEALLGTEESLKK